MTTRRQAEPRPAPVARGTARFQFIREVVSELRKVVWPTREEATRLTVMVIVVSCAVGIVLGIIDIGFSVLIRSVLIG
ncbi:MAG: preprotein translocase, SecE subunit [Dehalococcoidia bacterium]|nr:preprotein translocase, SecE subunit [Dehalococcoidia bacterium]